MEYVVKSGAADKLKTGCLIVGVWERRSLTEAGQAIDTASSGMLSAVLKRGELDGKLGDTVMLHQVAGIAAERVLLVGLGRERSYDEAAFRKAQTAALRALRASASVEAVNTLVQLPVKGRDTAWRVQQAVRLSEEAAYRMDDCRGEKALAERRLSRLARLAFTATGKAELGLAERGLAEGRAIAAGTALAKNLGNLPGNICTPTYLAEQAKALAREYPIKTKVLEQADMEKLGMGALLSVARGSRQPPKLIVMEYLQGPKKEKPIVLVGKGLTFDAGGISIKPSAKMDEMKFDMCGGASVFGTLKALAELKLPLNVVGIVPSSENLPDGAASKPGDIVTSMAGITIEVLNTDAEGRLILSDALTYAEKTYDPALCVDMATLTGACVVALGAHASGLFSNQPGLARQLLAAGEQAGDRAWELPLWPEYDEQIESPFADIANIATKGAGEAGAIIGATFLHRFTRNLKWAHLDIAGTAWNGKKATGRPVPLLVHFLMGQVARQA